MKQAGWALLGLIVCSGMLTACSTAGPMTPKGQSEQHSFLHDGIKRTYSIYTPPDIQKSRPVPLLVAIHGGGGSAEKWPSYTNNGFERLADRDHFILVYPNGLDGNWNDGRDVKRFYSHRNDIDDAGFLAALIDELTQSYPVDANRIYVTGASNGGMMAHRLAAEYADKITAIATVISSIPKNLEGKLHPARPVSVLVMNGTADPLVRWEGGPVKFGRTINGEVIPTEQTIEFWTRHNKCLSSPTTVNLPDTDPDDETTVTRTRYSNCQSGTEVVLYRIIGGGHTWPAYEDRRGHISKLLMDKVLGMKSRDIDACEVIWQFLKNQSKGQVTKH